MLRGQREGLLIAFYYACLAATAGAGDTIQAVCGSELVLLIVVVLLLMGRI
jgi:hypothetical protein